MKVKISEYWKGFSVGTFLLVILIIGVGLSEIHKLQIICAIIFLCLFFIGFSCSIAFTKDRITHFEKTHLGTPYVVIDQEPTKPFLRGLVNSFCYLPLFAFFLMILFIITNHS